MDNQPHYIEDDEITLKELILKIREFYRELLRSWKLIFLFVFAVLAIMVTIAVLTPAKYNAVLTFMVNEDEGSSMGGVGSILGKFGFGGSASEFNLEKILELAKSNKILKQAVFQKTTINGKEDYFANFIIKAYDFHKKWKKDTTGLKDFLFTHGNYAKFNSTEIKAMKGVLGKIKGNKKKGVEGILSTGYGEETSILHLGINSTNQNLSIELVKAIYDKLSQFYIKNATSKEKVTYDNLVEKVDSVKTELEKAEYALAVFKDSNRGLVTRKAQLKEARLTRKVKILSVMYGEVLKNQETADFILKNKTPFFQEIDLPEAPITPQKKSLLKTIVIGGFLGGFLGALFVIMRKIFRDAMREDDPSGSSTKSEQ